MSFYNLLYQQYGEKGILISWPNKIDEAILSDILLVKNCLLDFKKNEIQDLTNGYNSVLVLFNNEINAPNKIAVLKELLSNRKQSSEVLKTNTWQVPVCYHESFGIDIIEMAEQKKLSVSELINLHTKASYKVFCKGFLPGFMYLGGLNKKLHTPRKSSPRLLVPRNSVAIGGEQTGIYPNESPGGWHIIGRTPVSLFDITQKEISLIAIGDTIKFEEISLNEYEFLQKEPPKLELYIE